MSGRKIYEKDIRYSLLKPIVDWATKYSYRKVEIHGKENLPIDGATILTPNHCNTLMDAVVILRAHKEPTVFGARADLFNRPFIARLMYFIRILPLVRQRDGLRNVLKNIETQEIIIETLENGVRFCMYPEGTHRAKHSLRPLGKGAARAALAANEKFGDNKSVYIVPVGIEYGDYYRYRSTCLVNYGKPINVTEHIKESNEENEAKTIESLKKLLAQGMSELITYIPYDEDYESIWALTKMISVSSRKRSYAESGGSLYEDMMDNRRIIDEIQKLREENPDTMKEILEDAMEFEKKRIKKGVSIYSFKERKHNILNIIGKSFAALIGLPYFILSSVLSLPMWLTEVILRSVIKDPAFRNTGSFGVKLAMSIVLFPIYTVLAFIFAPWWLAAALIILWIPSYGYIHDYIEGCRRWFSDIRFLANRKLEKKFNKIIRKYKELNR